jgi:hypothetical protein
MTVSEIPMKAYLSGGLSYGNKAKKFSIKREFPLSNGRTALRTSPIDTLTSLLNSERFV